MLIVIGTGLLKGNISVIVGQLYAPSDNRRDAGFSIFYMGINLGAFLAPLVCGYLGQRVNWHLGFAAAGVGMVLGLVQYVLGDRYLGDAGAASGTGELARSGRGRPAAGASRWSVGALVAVAVCSASPCATGLITVSADADRRVRPATCCSSSRSSSSAGCSSSATGRRPSAGRLYVIGVFFLCAALFWSVFEQAGSTLNLFADRSTHNVDRSAASFPSSWFQSLNALFIIMFAPVFAWLWITLGAREPASPAKFAFGLIGVGAGFLVLVPAAQLGRAAAAWSARCG